ncbi:cell growth regulator with EF hand domain protein 1, partial [Rhinophrynus dorsalis]
SQEPDPNPFSLGPQQVRMLQEYLHEIDPKEENALNLERETAILHLFLLHDFDKSRLLDGLEMMQLVSGILSQNSQGKPAPESIIDWVDKVLDKQDLNKDGLLSAPELVKPPVYASEEDPSQDTMAMVIPPPQGPQEEEKVDLLEDSTITSNKQAEKLQERVLDPQSLDVQDIGIGQLNHPEPPVDESIRENENTPRDLEHEEPSEEIADDIEAEEEEPPEEALKTDWQEATVIEDEM